MTRARLGRMLTLAAASSALACVTPTSPAQTALLAAPPPPAWFSVPDDRPGALPVIVVTVGGVSVRAVLDTGATTSALSVELIEELALSPTGQERVRGADGDALDVPTFLADVQAGSLREQLTVSPMARAANIDAILGRDFLDDADLYIPRGAARVALFARGAGPREHLLRVPLERDADGLFVRLQASTPARRTVSVRMLLDTGASLSRITLTDAGADELNPELARRAGGAFGGVTNLGALVLADAKLAHARVGALLVNVDDAPGAPALLGMDALARFDVLVSTASGELFLGEAW